jgi:MoaA/NifB/PqqE/SkfB family radical SAM enzyme
MTNRKLIRGEAWGQLLYDPMADEFEAHLASDGQDVRVNRPISVGCLVTGRCNLKCHFCYGNKEALPRKEMTTQEWEVCFRRLREWGVMRVDVSGGEPTIRPDLPEILHSAVAAGLNVVLSTNGQLRKAEGAYGFPQGVRIHVSMDSGTAAVHEASRMLLSGRPSASSFSDTSTFIRKCLEQGVKTRVMTCIGPHNQYDLLELAEHIALLGVEDWSLSRVLPAGRAGQDYSARWAVDDEHVLEQVRTIQDSFPWITTRFSNRTQQEGYFLLLLPDGTLATQFTDQRDKVSLGNLKEMNLDDLLHSEVFDLRKHSEKWIARTFASSSGASEVVSIEYYLAA